jgi:hypothetical protein
LQYRMAWKGVIDTRNKCARCNNDNSEQIHSKPHLFHAMGVRSDEVVGSAQDQATLRTQEENPEHRVVHPLYAREPRLGECGHAAICNYRQE